ncbi:MFS transporter [Propionibacterium acidifaciens]|uniref:MFS transporter n=1 Tax=Propionibacterium acidifaciens TaxID=556499 RepID=UPI0028E8BE7D|nr:MFS transporter [Propionibacterium acidifaciens]
MSSPARPPSDPPVALPPAGRAALRAGVVGNRIDNVHVFLPLTALAPVIARLAGPAAATGTGAVIVIAMLLGRPVGGLVLGPVSDRLGRTRTTRPTIGGTASCALLIGCMPTHRVLGAGAIVLVLVLRFLGGVFVAGEYSAAIPLAMEWSAPGRRGLMSGLILSMAPWAQALVAFAVAGLLTALGPERYAEWGWRVLFLLGAACSLGMLGHYRTRVADAPLFHRRRRSSAAAGAASARCSSGAGRAPSGRSSTGLWLLTDTTVLILTTSLSTDAGLPAARVSLAMGAASVAQALSMTPAGHLSTRTGRRALLVGWGIVAAVLGPVLWRTTVSSRGLGRAAALAGLLQVATVAAYGARLGLSVGAVPHSGALHRLRHGVQPLARPPGPLHLLPAGGARRSAGSSPWRGAPRRRRPAGPRPRPRTDRRRPRHRGGRVPWAGRPVNAAAHARRVRLRRGSRRRGRGGRSGPGRSGARHPCATARGSAVGRRP